MKPLWVHDGDVDELSFPRAVPSRTGFILIKSTRRERSCVMKTFAPPSARLDKSVLRTETLIIVR